MKINTQWQRHVKAWRERGLSQADYCHQHGLNRKTFSLWTRRDQGDPSMDRGTSLDLIAVQLSSSVPIATAEASTLLLRFPHGAQLELSTAVPPRWLAELLRCLA